MKIGSSMLGILFTLFFVISIALNVVGCDFCRGESRESDSTVISATETIYLREIADILKISVSPEKTSGDIAFEIRQCLSNSITYKGPILSSEAFEKANVAIRITEDREIFKSYHEFINKIAGKRFIILE